MSNGLPLTGSVSIPTYQVDGLSSPDGNGIYTMTFSGGAPPTDGSLAMAFITLNISGWKWGNSSAGVFQRLVWFSGATGQDTDLWSIELISNPVVAKQVAVTGYSFVP